MKRLISLTACVLLVCIASQATAAWKPLNWTIKYDATVLPNDPTVGSTAVQAWNGTAYVDASRFTIAGDANNLTKNSVSGGIYSASTINKDAAVTWSRNLTSGYPAGMPMPDSNTGYTVEIRARMNNIDGTYTTNFFFMDEGTTGVTRSWGLNFQKDSTTGIINVGVNTNTTSLYKVLGSITDGNDWHTYRITADNSGIKLYVDGDTTATQSLAAYGTTSLNSIRFGDASTTNDSDYDIDYIHIYSGGAIVGCNTTFLGGDVNQDCEVNLVDMNDLAINWLETQDWNFTWNADQYPNTYNTVFLKGSALFATYSTSTATNLPIVSLGGGNNACRLTLTPTSTWAGWSTRDTIDATENGTWNPAAVGNNTIEFRMRVVSDEGDPNRNIYAFSVVACDWDITPGLWSIRGFFFNIDSIVENSSSAGENKANYVSFDCSQWNTYRFDYSVGTAVLTYWNGSAWQYLLTSSVGRSLPDAISPTPVTRSNSAGNQFKMGKFDGWGGYGITEVDYVSWKGIGGKRILGDVSLDNNINFADFAKVANDWLLTN